MQVMPEVEAGALMHSPYDMEAERIPYPDPRRSATPCSDEKVTNRNH